MRHSKMFCRGRPSRTPDFPSVYDRILGTKGYLDNIAVLTDGILVARWSEERIELNSLTSRSEALSSKGAHEYGEFLELEQLKEQRSVAGKSLIKCSRLTAPHRTGASWTIWRTPAVLPSCR